MPAPDLFDAAVQAGHASFSLAAIGEALSERETVLVDMAIKAGALGAFQVLRPDDTD